MKGKMYSIEKIIQILSEAKMTSITAVCRKYDICMPLVFNSKGIVVRLSVEQNCVNCIY